MRIRIIDFVGNPGGGIRFAVETIKALARDHPEISFEICSYGAALQRYHAQLSDEPFRISYTAVQPERHQRTQLTRLVGSLPLTGRLTQWLTWSYSVPAALLANCDAVWFPWVHSHRLSAICDIPLVGSLHDIILLQFVHLLDGYLPKSLVYDEHETLEHWLSSPARVVVSSKATVAALQNVFGITTDRIEVISILGDHAAANITPQEMLPWTWSQQPFLLCPANIMPHKNHERLFEGVARWGARHPLVLTGERTNLTWPNRRGLRLRRLAESQGLCIGTDLIPLGYVPNRTYYNLLNAAWAMVMPTLAEGGGSFPVLEAMLRGIPVACADIPVLREQMALTGGEVLWFNPEDPLELADRLTELEVRYDEYKVQFIDQIRRLRHRSWAQIAADYWAVIAAAVHSPTSVTE